MYKTVYLLLLSAIFLGAVHSQIIGQVEFASTEQVRGWVCDIAFPSRSVTVNVTRDSGIPVGSIRASVARPDIAPRCGGNPATGFILRFSPATISALSDNNPHTLQVAGLRAFFAGSVRLSGSPVTVSSAFQNIVGFLDTANGTLAEGWACQPSFPNRNLQIRIFIDDAIFAGSTQANRQREPAVGAQCGGNSQHGFRLVFPQNIINILSNGQPHSVSAFAIPRSDGDQIANPVQLSGSPKTVLIISGPPRGFLDVANVTLAAGWACDPLQPGQTLTVNFVLDGNTFAGSTQANLIREPAVGAQCGGNSQHGFSFRFPQNIVNILTNGQSHTISAFALPFPSGSPTQLNNSPQTIPATQPSVPHGFLDVANITSAAGWACDPLRPNQPLTVNVFVDGTLFAGSAIANLQREPAVGAQCGGNSFHGWTLQFSQNIINILNNGQTHTVSAFAVPFPTGSQVQLSNSPRTVQGTQPSVPRGFLDIANATFAAGWACDPLRPTTSLTVNVFVDGTLFAGSVIANLPRETAVGQQCGGNSQHGWTLQFPQNIVNLLSNGQSHTVSAFVVPFPSGSQIQLSGSPKTVLVPIIRGGVPIGFLDVANATIASGWACDPTLPGQTLTVNVLVDGNFAGSALANLQREPAVGAQCGGNAQHGWVIQFPQNIINLLSNGQSHTVAAFAIPFPTGTPTQLSASPKTVLVPIIRGGVPIGFLDVANATTASGWACDPTLPTQTLTVNVVVDGNTFAGAVLASIPREAAVGAQCGGNSQHGWVLQFPQNIVNLLSDGGSHSVAAFAIPFPSGNPTQLSNSPQNVQVIAPSIPRGFLDVANATFAAGWACDPLRPNQPLTVNILIDGTINGGTTVANLQRETAVGAQCGGNSFHGWTIQFSQNIINLLSNGQSHTVAAFAVPFPTGTQSQLTNSPQNVQVILPSVPRGFLDVANNTFASGWACDPNRPTQSLTVNVFVDGSIFAGSTQANLQRETAVGAQCGGNSFHGWTIQFPQNIINLLSNGQSHSVSAFAVPFPSGTQIELSNSPQNVQVTLPSVPRGFLDVANNTFASGWACDPNRPTQSLTVNVVIDGSIFAGSTQANLQREPGVGAQCGGNSQHGWTIQFSQNIINLLSNGQSHSVSAFAVPFPSGTQVELSNSPQNVQTIVFGTPRGFLDSADVNTAAGWACDPLNPNTPLTVTFTVDGSINAGQTTASNQRESAVGTQCGGSSAHGFTFQFPQNIVNILNDGNSHTVSAFTSSGPNQIQLDQSPRTVQGAGPVAAPIGFLDVASPTRAAGWTCDPTNFNQPLTVVFFIDGSIAAGSTTANLPREPAVGQRCGQNSARGFDFTWPSNIQQILQSGTHTVSAFALDIPTGNQQALSNSPMTVSM